METKEKVLNQLKGNWSDFHLSFLDGVVMSSPVIPVDSISIWRVPPIMIHTVQVRMMTLLVPPGSFVLHSTVTTPPAVIVLIFSCKSMATMTSKRISCSTWKKTPKNQWTNSLYDNCIAKQNANHGLSLIAFSFFFCVKTEPDRLIEWDKRISRCADHGRILPSLFSRLLISSYSENSIWNKGYVCTVSVHFHSKYFSLSTTLNQCNG